MSNTKLEQVRSLAHEFGNICVNIIETALRHIRKKQSFQDNPDIACSVLVGRASNDLNDYFREHYRHDFQAPIGMDDPVELTGLIAMQVADVVRKHSKLILQDMHQDGINDETFETLLFADIRTKVLEIIADNYGIEEELENVEFYHPACTVK